MGIGISILNDRGLVAAIGYSDIIERQAGNFLNNYRRRSAESIALNEIVPEINGIRGSPLPIY